MKIVVKKLTSPHNATYKQVRVNCSEDGVDLKHVLAALLSFKDQAFLSEAFAQQNVSVFVKEGTRYLPLGNISQKMFNDFKNMKASNPEKLDTAGTKIAIEDKIVETIANVVAEDVDWGNTPDYMKGDEESEPMITPKFVEIEIPDSVQDWNKKFIERGQQLIGLKGINSIYVYDENRQVFLAEITPSYELNSAYPSVIYELEESLNDLTPEQQAYVDEVEDGWRLANGENPVTYVHCSDIDRARYKRKVVKEFTPDEWNKILEYHDGNKKEAYQEELETIMDYVKGNPNFA